jgi:hypothetical protein
MAETAFQYGGRANPRLQPKRPPVMMTTVLQHPENPQHSFKSRSVTQQKRTISDFELSEIERELEAAEWARLEKQTLSAAEFDELTAYLLSSGEASA